MKLGSVLSDVFGVSGMAMLRQLADGQSDPEKLSQLSRGRARSKIPQLLRALQGQMSVADRLVLRLHLARLEQTEKQLTQLDTELEQRMEPYRAGLLRLQQIPGVGVITAMTMVAEMGLDMTVFPTAGHLAAWAGVSPGNHQSGGKRRQARTRKGNPYLCTALVEAAQSARKLKRGYFRDKFYRLRARRGDGRAAMAIAHKIVVCAWHMLKEGVDYRDLGDAYLDRFDERRVVAKLLKRLDTLGYQVQATKRTAAPAAA